MTAFAETEMNVVPSDEDQGLANGHRNESQDLKKLGPLTIIWQNVIFFIVFHVGSIYGLYLGFACAKWQSWVFAVLLMILSGLGVTAGAHRLWTHNSYKAKLPLRIFLAIGQTLTLQKSIYDWVRDHRVHHKFPETNADPTNVQRGFFFSHIGWLMVKKQKDVIEKGKTIDFKDVLADPVVSIQYRFYIPISIFIGIILPVAISHYCWNERLTACIFAIVMYRIIHTLHSTSLVNSISHLWGMKPYDKNISATNINWVSTCALGEGFHNYHHTFPWDYATSELGYKFNFTTSFINYMASIGQAYDLKTTSPEIIHQRKLKTGDGSYFNEEERNEWAHQSKDN